MTKQTKRADVSASPILNGPYDEPEWHYATDPSGHLDYQQPRKGRRIFAPDTPQVPLGAQDQGSVFDRNDFASDYRDSLVNQMREQVSAWRREGWPGVTSRVTRDLLTHWFANPDSQPWHKLFFAQREAIETAIWLNEVAARSNQGPHVLKQLRLAQESVGRGDDALPRIGFKMATGTGKTVVMACLILYHYLNRQHYRNDPRFADYFLLVAPGVTIRDRLSVLRVDTQAESDTDAQDCYRQRKLIPRAYQGLAFERGKRVAVRVISQFGEESTKVVVL